jgi:hypothetical protein
MKTANYKELDPRTLNERMAVQLIALFGFGGLFMVGLVIKLAVTQGVY